MIAVTRPARARGRRPALAAGLAGLALVAAACGPAAPAPAPGPAPGPARPGAGPSSPAAPGGAAFRPAGPHPGVNLRVLLVTDGSPAVTAIRAQLASEGVLVTVVRLGRRAGRAGRPVIGPALLTRRAPGGRVGGNFDGIVLPGVAPRGLSGAEESALARYERTFGVRELDAYTPPDAALGMAAPAYAGPLRGAAAVTPAGAAAGFGYLRRSFPFSGGAAGPPLFGYLARPLAAGAGGGGATPLVTAAIPGAAGSGAAGSGALVWQDRSGGRERLGLGFGYGSYSVPFRYLAPGLVSWLTHGVYTGYWRSYLTVDYDDVLNADSQWSTAGHCTPPSSGCPPGTKPTAAIRMTPADVRYAVAWQRRHRFEMEFLYNGGSAARFARRGPDPLLAALRPAARQFYWVNHTYTHADLGCEPDYRVVPWRCVRSGGRLVWASLGLINAQIRDNLTWARQHGIPAEPGVVATGEYSGLRILPQQPSDNPNLIEAIRQDHIRWIALDASRDPDMRPVGRALGVPRHPIDVGYDVDTVAAEVNEFNWFNTARRDGGSGLCATHRATTCLRPLDPRTGWTSSILPGQVAIVLAAVLGNDPRPFFLHQSNLTGDRLGYPVMDGVLSAYRDVFGPAAPIVNLPLPGDGAALHRQDQWAAAAAAGTVTAYVSGGTLTVSGPPGTPVPITVPAAAAAPGQRYAGARSGWVTLGSRPLRLVLGAGPFRAGPRVPG
jgi:hypothetical protein